MKQSLRLFLEIHPNFENTEEKIYTPRGDYHINFWIEGGFTIGGNNKNLEVNYNNGSFLILGITDNLHKRIARIPWKRIIAFELIVKDKFGTDTSDLIYLKPESRN